MEISNNLFEFVSGSAGIECWIASLFFIRFWKKTQDRLFLIFSIAFGMLGLERIVLIVFRVPDESSPYIFSIRLLAFLLFLVGIIDKNRIQAQRK